jgi:hypothetical protein
MTLTLDLFDLFVAACALLLIGVLSRRWGLAVIAIAVLYALGVGDLFRDDGRS